MGNVISSLEDNGGLDSYLFYLPYEVLLLFLNESFTNLIKQSANRNGNLSYILEKVANKLDSYSKYKREIYTHLRVASSYLKSREGKGFITSLIKKLGVEKIKLYASRRKEIMGNIFAEYIEKVENMKFEI